MTTAQRALARLTALTALMIVAALLPCAASAEGIMRKVDVPAMDSVPMVRFKGDTIPAIIYQRNYSRFDRGLFNNLYIPARVWAFGLTAQYGELKTDDLQLLSLMSGLDFNGKLYSINPTVSYMFRSNEMVGLRFNYTRGEANLDHLSVDFDEDLNFDIGDISYYSQSYGISVFYRYYVGLTERGRFAVFNEVAAGVSSGSARFKRPIGENIRDTRTITTSGSLEFSPGLSVFIMDNAAFQISFGVFGLHWTHQSQRTDGIYEGSRTTSGANFRFNIFNIRFGVNVFI